MCRVHDGNTTVSRSREKELVLDARRCLDFTCDSIVQIRLPLRALSDHGSYAYVRLFSIPYFSGIIMYDALQLWPLKNESVIVNLDDKTGPARILCITRNALKRRLYYFYRYCNQRLPVELTRYFGVYVGIGYNYARKRPSLFDDGITHTELYTHPPYVPTPFGKKK